MGARYRATGALLILAACLAWAARDGPPYISQGGIRNAASRMPPTLAGGAIARGSLFTIRGVRLGPVDPVRSAEPVLSLGGTSVAVNGKSVPLLFVTADRILARMPVEAPLGELNVTVIREGESSPGRAAHVVEASPGLFGPHLESAWELPDELRTLRRPVMAPEGVVTLHATGMGDGKRLRILAGGVPVKKILEAGDVLRFVLPSLTPAACEVPVMVEAGGRWSNVVAVAVEREPGDCTAPAGAVSPTAVFVLLHGDMRVEFKGAGFEDQVFDMALGGFPDGTATASAEGGFVLPPPGTCTAYTGVYGLGGLVQPPATEEMNSRLTEFNVPFRIAEHAARYGGPSFTVEGPRGSRMVKHDWRHPDYYAGPLGGSQPDAPFQKMPLFLAPGAYRIHGEGGRGVGPYEGKVQFPAPIVLRNRAKLREVSRSRGVTFEWTAGAGQVVIIAAGSVDPATGATGVALCQARPGESRFTIPPEMLANLPPSGDGSDGNLPLGGLAVAAFPVKGSGEMKGEGIVKGVILPASASGRQAIVR